MNNAAFKKLKVGSVVILSEECQTFFAAGSYNPLTGTYDSCPQAVAGNSGVIVKLTPAVQGGRRKPSVTVDLGDGRHCFAFASRLA